MGRLLDATEAMGSADRVWAAQMIAPATDEGHQGRAPTLVTTFDAGDLDTPVLHITAFGLYAVFLNGQRVGSAKLTPGWTCYDDRVAYQSYDIAGLLTSGENRIEIWLGNGWYRSPLMWFEGGVPNLWGERVGAMAEIVDGGNLLCKTDETWVSGHAPVTANGIYYGEDFDARLGADEARGAVEIIDGPNRVVAQEAHPVVELDALPALKEWTDAEGRTTYDFGQNIGGYLRLKVKAAAGTKFIFEHAEVLGPDGEIDNRNYRRARAELHYIASGEGEEVYAPFFTFFGFRYARLVVEGAVESVQVEAVPVSSVPTRAGGFDCGVPEVNRLVENTIWSQRGNFIDVPTDCPQRDERLGWTGDAQVFAGTACWLADCERFLAKYMRDMRHDQRDSGAVPHFTPDPTLHYARIDGDWAGSTGWGDAIVIIPWQLYLHYGDKGVLRENFPAMLKWLNYLWDLSGGPLLNPHSTWARDGFTFGDWLQPVGDNRKPRPTIGDDCAASLYHFIATRLTAQIAGILGDEEQADHLTARAEEIRTAFQAEFFTTTGRMAYGDQTSYALAFLNDLVPDQHFERAKAHFTKIIVDADYLIGTGFIGTPALLPALTKLGLTEVAEKVFLNRNVPGWLYQVERGATTIWERWDAIGEDGTIYDPDMNSYNHYAYGAVCQWLFEDVAGVTPDAEAPGFDRVLLRPCVLPELGHITIWHDCRHGRIEAGWTLDGTRTTYTVTLPEGCEGRMDARGFKGLVVDGKEITDQSVIIACGRHEITFDL